MKSLLKLFWILGVSLIALSFTACSDDDDDPKSTESALLEMKFDDDIVTVQPIITGTDIKFFVAYDATAEDLKEMVPAITVSNKATVNPASGSKVDFSGDPVKFTVTAEDGVTKTVYTVTCARSKSTDAEILQMTFDSPLVVEQPTINGTDIHFIVSHEATDEDIKVLTPVIEISAGATIDPASESAVDFSDGPVEFTVTSEDGTVQAVYTVTCERNQNTEALITKMTFSAPVVVEQPTIDGTNIHFFVAADATDEDLKKLTPVIEISAGATIDPASGSPVDFSNGAVEFTVTSEDKANTTVYTVSYQRIGKYDFEEWIVVNPTSLAKYRYSHPTGGWSSSNPPITLMLLINSIDGFTVTQSNDKYSGESAARIETLASKGSTTLYPKIIAGSLFLGEFSSKVDRDNPLTNTLFGIPFNKKPIAIKGYYKYNPGEIFYRCPDSSKYNVVNSEEGTKDECAINAILYEIDDENSPYITGADTYNFEKNGRLVAVAKLADGTAKAEYTAFQINFKDKDGKTAYAYDPTKKYRMSIICSSSAEGDTFSGAPGSVLFVDDIEVISE